MFIFKNSINPTNELSGKSVQFNGKKSQWINERCADAKLFASPLTETQRNMINILCSGPKFNLEQSRRLSNVLYQIQDIYTGTQVCIPKSFDVCLNLDHIWDFTYIRHSDDQLKRLLMSELNLPRLRAK